MSDLPLDLKYRPKKFADVVGNESVVKLLLTRSRQGTLAGRSMMFGGPKGCGKTSLARITARAIVCDSLADGEPCNECPACRSISDESSLSFDEYDAATQGTVDRVRTLVDELDYGTFDGKPRLVILDEAHRLSKPSQDALLKAMEDRRLVVILCTTEARKIVDAIRSRVEEYPIAPPTEDMIVALMSKVCTAENITFQNGALEIAARSLKNCPRECVCCIDTLQVWGGITTECAKQMFRYDQMQLVNDVLFNIDFDLPKAYLLLDQLTVEGAVWIRDTMITAIASAVRQNIGVKSSFPVKTTFFSHRGADWTKLAQLLGSIDKPNMADIEAALFASAVYTPTFMQAKPVPTLIQPQEVSSPAPIISQSPSLPPAPIPVVPAPTPKPAPPVVTSPVPPAPPTPPVPPTPPAPVSKMIEIDGVKYSSTERLTSIDDKIEKVKVEPVAEIQFDKVELDIQYAPIPLKEFASGLIRQFKSEEASKD